MSVQMNAFGNSMIEDKDLEGMISTGNYYIKTLYSEGYPLEEISSWDLSQLASFMDCRYIASLDDFIKVYPKYLDETANYFRYGEMTSFQKRLARRGERDLINKCKSYSEEFNEMLSKLDYSIALSVLKSCLAGEAVANYSFLHVGSTECFSCIDHDIPFCIQTLYKKGYSKFPSCLNGKMWSSILEIGKLLDASDIIWVHMYLNNFSIRVMPLYEVLCDEFDFKQLGKFMNAALLERLFYSGNVIEIFFFRADMPYTELVDHYCFTRYRFDSSILFPVSAVLSEKFGTDYCEKYHYFWILPFVLDEIEQGRDWSKLSPASSYILSHYKKGDSFNLCFMRYLHDKVSTRFEVCDSSKVVLSTGKVIDLTEIFGSNREKVKAAIRESNPWMMRSVK